MFCRIVVVAAVGNGSRTQRAEHLILSAVVAHAALRPDVACDLDIRDGDGIHARRTAVEQRKRQANDEYRGEGSNGQPDFLITGRGTDQETCFQVLRRGTSSRRADAYHCADA